MISLTTPVVQPNVARIEVVDVSLRESAADPVAEITVAVRSPAASNRAVTFTLKVMNGTSIGIAANPSPSRWEDVIQVKLGIATPTGYDTIEASYAGANKAARKRGVESALLSLGVIDASLAGTVA